MTSVLIALLVAAPLALPARRAEAATTVPIKIQSVVVLNGHLVALGSLGNQLFAVPLNLTAAPGPTASCPILNLNVGAINLDLLGLFVQTSPICLSVTAQRGHGNLLGNLLCGVANLLNRGLSLQQVLNSLHGPRLQQFLAALTSLLQGGLNAVGSTTPTAQQAPTGCPVLNLSLGPVDLNLLGLLVHLDNCANGPVTVMINAIPSTSVGGGLLGDLLCSLSNLLNDPAGILQQLITAINNL